MTAPENKRVYRAPRGTQLNTKGWVQEAALRMLLNNLDPEVAEWPEKLVVYGGIGKAARNWESFDAIVETLKNLEGGGIGMGYSQHAGMVIFRTGQKRLKNVYSES